MLAALTGTPGTGKSVVAALLEREGFNVCDLNDLARRSGALREYDPERQTWEIDMEVLERSVPQERPLVLVGHLSHLLPVDLAVVFRCHPETLRERLKSRGWKQSKIRENVEAEALGVITSEVLMGTDVLEVDTTSTSPEEAAKVVMDILSGSVKGRERPAIDWSEAILDWF